MAEGETTPRSAVDILLSIEQKLILLEQRFQNSENNIKLLLAKQNKNISTSETVINKDNFENRKKTNEFEKLAESKGIDLGLKDKKNQSSNTVKKGNEMVSQLVQYNDGSLVFMATVEVTDQNGRINKTRTNTKGRWSLVLGPGDYMVHISTNYPPSAGKKNVDMKYSVNVPPSENPVELNPLIVQ